MNAHKSRGLEQLRVWTALAFSVAGAALLGWHLGYFQTWRGLQEGQIGPVGELTDLSYLYSAIGAITLSVLIATVKDLALEILNLVRYLMRTSPEDDQINLLKSIIAMGAIALSIAFAAGTYHREPLEPFRCSSEAADCQGAEDRVDCLQCQLKNTIGELENRLRDVEKYAKQLHVQIHAGSPLLFENARTDGGEINQSSRGVALQQNHQEQLKDFTATLQAACAAGEQASLKVLGSASSAPFAGVSSEKSDKLNVQVANCRAATAASTLRQLLVEEGWTKVALTAPECPSKKPFERALFKYGRHLAQTDQDLIARSVFIQIVEEAGGCFGKAPPASAAQAEAGA